MRHLWRGLLLASVPVQAMATEDGYHIGPGDVLQIDVFQEDDISARYTVAEDGSIELPMLGQVMAGGLLVEALDEQLTAELGERFLVNPQVTVRVEEFKSQMVQVLGEVEEPGVYYLTGPTTLEEMLALAGGIRAERATREALIKNELDESIAQRVVNLDTLRVSGEDAVYLRPGDVVYVLQGQVVSVNGQVKDPGDISFQEGMTILEAISAAGGLLPTANTRKVTLRRDGTSTVINVHRVIKQRDEDIVLLSGDKLIIEESIW